MDSVCSIILKRGLLSASEQPPQVLPTEDPGNYIYDLL